MKLAIIGCGRMGEAILAGLLKAGTLAADDIVATQPDDARRAYLHETYGVTCYKDNTQIGTADVVLLAVKPQVIDLVVKKMSASGVLGGNQLILSIAVGISAKRLEGNLAEGAHVVRVMPNTPALVGFGMSVISAGTHANADDIAQAQLICNAIGDTVVLDEKFQDTCSALSGSGPAYFELIADALSRAGVRHGLARDVAQKLVVSTMRGTAELIEQTGEHPQVLIDQVTSPGGTTIAALETMEKEGLRSSLTEGVAAAIARAKEL